MVDPSGELAAAPQLPRRGSHSRLLGVVQVLLQSCPNHPQSVGVECPRRFDAAARLLETWAPSILEHQSTCDNQFGSKALGATTGCAAQALARWQGGLHPAWGTTSSEERLNIALAVARCHPGYRWGTGRGLTSLVGT